MFAELPKDLKKRVYDHLMSHDFIAAKAIHDAWIQNKMDSQSQSQSPCAIPQFDEASTFAEDSHTSEILPQI